jgi:hypothetical protein
MYHIYLLKANIRRKFRNLLFMGRARSTPEQANSTPPIVYFRYAVTRRLILNNLQRNKASRSTERCPADTRL